MGMESQPSIRSPRRRRRGALLRRILPAVLAGLALFAALALNEHLRTGVGIFPHALRRWAKLFLLIAAAGAGAGWFLDQSRPVRRRLPAALPPAILLISCILFLFSGAMQHPWTYFLAWIPPAGHGFLRLAGGQPGFVGLTAVLTAGLLWRRRLPAWALAGLLFAAQVFCFAALLRATGGAALYKDDHPSFLFRLWEYAQTFPQLINYNPWWNGGVATAYCVSSGTGALGLPLFPLWRWAPVHEVYTAGLGFAYIIAVPLLAAASLRIMGAGRTVAACAGLLALGISRHFFLWLLHYGTACAPLVAAFTLPVAACLYRVLWLDRQELWLGAVLVASVFMLLQWPPGALMALPLGAAGLLAWRQWSWPKIRFLLVCAAIVLALWHRQLLVILLKAGSVMDHVLEDSAAPAASGGLAALGRGFGFLVAHLQEGHPLLLFLGLAGLCALTARAVRRWFGPIMLLFALLAGWGPQIKPQLELGRMAIPLLFVAVAPAAVACGRLLRATDRCLAPARAALLALLVLGALNVADLYRGRGRGFYRVLPEEIRAFAAQLHAEVPAGGRVMFAGPTVHYFGHGHVAYLPVLAGREMMAVDYYHFPTTYVHYDYPPRGFKETPERVREFVRLYNITHVVTYHDQWKRFFRAQTEDCEELAGFAAGGASVFRMRRAAAPFLQGAGEMRAGFNRLDVRLAEPGAEAVLCYNWAEGLAAPAPVELFPYPAANGVRLLGIRPHGVAEFRIRYRSRL